MTKDKSNLIYSKKYNNTSLNKVHKNERNIYTCETDFLHPNEVVLEGKEKEECQKEWQIIEDHYLYENLKVRLIEENTKDKTVKTLSDEDYLSYMEEMYKKIDEEFDITNENVIKHVKIEGLNQEFISLMVNEIFRPHGRSRFAFPVHLVQAIVLQATSIFRSEPNLIYLENVENNKLITVIGDVHGEFTTVKKIFHMFGKVSEDHIYIFNGDFVDRGQYSCEIALLLYSLKIVYPNNIYINRGNHESRSMSNIYGFREEVFVKYDRFIHKLFLDSFDALPLSICVNKEYLVMHGGLMSNPYTKIEEILRINRFCEPDSIGLFHDLLWTDPTEEADDLGPSKRGLGFSFGKNITKKFLNHNNLKKIIRSHEMKLNGIDYSHDKCVITVFSAPNYCGIHRNRGAVLHIKPGKGVIDELNDDVNLHYELFM
ncbi:protein serine/threonine phosphatase [Hanseniaspora uvarum]|nr:protein serine/threonine phosphatase [Hanseniaspora uvarum]